jgi:hypothetical protein
MARARDEYAAIGRGAAGDRGAVFHVPHGTALRSMHPLAAMRLSCWTRTTLKRCEGYGCAGGYG